MITTVTLNPCLDQTILVPGLKAGGYNRVEKTLRHYSGKGVNVSLALQQLGQPTACLGFRPAAGGEMLEALLESRSIPFYGVPVQGNMRVNVKVTDTQTGQMTELNEGGSPVLPEEWAAFRRRFTEALARTSLLVADGSVPPGVPETAYREMISEAREKGIPSVLDAAGILLREGLKAAPWLVKPNRFELETLLGHALPSLRACEKAARELLDSGVRYVCLSLGGEGALLACREGSWFSPCVPIAVQGWQGAGDSMVAGLCVAARRGLPPPDMLRFGAAAAHASLLRPGTELCTLEDFEALLPRIAAEAI